MSPSDVSLIWLLLLSRSSHLVAAADSTISAGAEHVTKNTMQFKWTQPNSEGLQYVLLQATPTIDNGTSVEVLIAVVLGQGSLANLEPYTKNANSVIYVNADDNSKGLILKTVRLRNFPGVPSPPTIKSVVSTGQHSIQVSWLAPEKPNGKIKNYLVACYLFGRDTRAARKRVNAHTLSAELTYLSSNSLYECDVTATTEGVGCIQRHARTSSERSSLVKTWPGTTEQPIIKSATARGPRTLYLEWLRPTSVYGKLDHYRVTMVPAYLPELQKEIKTKSDSLNLLITQMLPEKEYRFTLWAYVLPNEEGQGGGYSEPSLSIFAKTSADGSDASVDSFDPSIEKYNWELGSKSNDAGASVPEIAN
ncbi:unnamed protein product [Schistocephalus solidus]|uniref:Fibronectin type-III domain-containing protein n=1 Tax=Schistocephalus solidus TaxID=70667 RepID=A0A183TSC2_SCHSO|nr:unnamed protein product [Schistocephalus solidus]